MWKECFLIIVNYHQFLLNNFIFNPLAVKYVGYSLILIILGNVAYSVLPAMVQAFIGEFRGLWVKYQTGQMICCKPKKIKLTRA